MPSADRPLTLDSFRMSGPEGYLLEPDSEQKVSKSWIGSDVVQPRVNIYIDNSDPMDKCLFKSGECRIFLP